MSVSWDNIIKRTIQRWDSFLQPILKQVDEPRLKEVMDSSQALLNIHTEAMNILFLHQPEETVSVMTFLTTFLLALNWNAEALLKLAPKWQGQQQTLLMTYHKEVSQCATEVRQIMLARITQKVAVLA